jgi:hypothetical protein
LLASVIRYRYIYSHEQSVVAFSNVKFGCADSKKGKGEGKVHPRTDHEGPEAQQGYSSILSLT